MALDISTSSQNEFEDEKIKGLKLNSQIIQTKQFNQCEFIRCSFKETHFIECQFVDCLFQDCDLSLAKFNCSSFNANRFVSSKLAGINWTESRWKKNRLLKMFDFYDCLLNHNTFFGMKLKDIKIQNCIARNVDFSECDLSGACCIKSDFTNSIFFHSNLTETDFSGATNYAIAASQNTLKKTRFSLPEAMSLLNDLDIILTDNPD